ncbi:MAG: hypothetical protein HeimC2_37230 [Candidatus Heimdallarchaeota archaeon LC_2]|nr:MAG: hypothetical protein HeimC2_37230 [Candidatus Heimdallarchaeota archaeon LC_2]
MEFQKVVNKRKMIRSFTDRAIPKSILDRIIENIFRGPSAGFSQGIEILILQNQLDKALFFSQWGSKEERSKSYKKWPKMENASVILIVCSHKNAYLDRYAEKDKGWTDKDEKRWPVPYWHIDAGMAALLGLLTLVDEDLGAVFTGCDLDKTRKNFNIPDEYTPIGSILMGYPESVDLPSPSLKRGRRKIDQIVHYGKWSTK